MKDHPLTISSHITVPEQLGTSIVIEMLVQTIRSRNAVRIKTCTGQQATLRHDHARLPSGTALGYNVWKPLASTNLIIIGANCLQQRLEKTNQA